MKIFCDNKSCAKHKCKIEQTFVIIPKNRQYAFALMRTGYCPVCGRHYTLITNYLFIKEGSSKVKPNDEKLRAFGVFKPVHSLFKGDEADRIFENIFEFQKAVLYEVLKD